MTTAVLPTAVADSYGSWRRHGLALAVAATVLLALFGRDGAAIVSTWWTSTTFGHCIFIAPIVGWLVWQRRGELAQVTPVGWWPGLALVGAGGAGWLAGAAASVTFARELGLILMLGGATVTLLGPRIARGLAFPLGYALFLVPFGEWLEAPLQVVTVRLVMPLLALSGLPATSDGVMIHAGRYYFEIAEACSGAKFVIAMAAFGVLVAGVCFRSWRRRGGFLIAALVVPVLANGVRAFATIWVADRTSVELAAGFDHIVYGWLWFGLVMAATLAIGWRWFDRPADAPAFDAATLQGPVRRTLPIVPATLLVLALAASFPAWSAVAGRNTVPLAPHLDLPDVPGWHRVPLSTQAGWQPYYPGADHWLIGRYADAYGHRVDVGIAVFARQRDGAELIAYGTGAEGDGNWLRVGDVPDLAEGSAMRIRAPGPVNRVVVTWYALGSTITASPLNVKLLTLKARLVGGDQRAVAVHLSVEAPNDDDRSIARFVRAEPVQRLVAAVLAGPPAGGTTGAGARD